MSAGPQTQRSPLETGAHLLAQVIDESDEAIIGVCHSLLVVRFKTAPDASKLQTLTDHAQRLVDAKGRVSLLVIVTVDQAPQVDPDLQSETDRFISTFTGKVLAQAVVLTGPGFSSAALRDWTSRFVEAGAWPTRSFASLEGACGWMARRPEQTTELNRARKLFEAVSPCMGLGLPTS